MIEQQRLDSHAEGLPPPASAWAGVAAMRDLGADPETHAVHEAAELDAAALL